MLGIPSRARDGLQPVPSGRMPPKKSVQLSGVVVAQSAISSIDPDEGVLVYRGYDIVELSEHSTYEEVAFLLLHGELPADAELSTFREELAQRELPPAVAQVVDELALTAPPVDLLRTAVFALASTEPDRSANDREAGLRKAARLIAAAPVVVARHHRRRQGLEPVEPDPETSWAEGFLAMPARRAARRALGADLRDRDDPPRRARDERVDLHGARHRGHGRRPTRRRHGRHRGALRAAPRRRERGGDAALRAVGLCRAHAR